MPSPATAPTTIATAKCKINNNTSFDVIVLSPNGIGNPDTVYPTSNGSSVIPKGTSASLDLDPTQLYNLIVCTSASLFPIANLAVQSDLTTNLFADITVAQTDYVTMTHAAAFQQAIMACPESAMASGYTAAVTKAAAAPDVDTANKVMSDFFQSTSGYKDVTADQVTAIVTYYNSFPLVWAESSTNVTYYLYSSNGTANSFNGTVTLSLPGSIDIKKPNCGYSCVFTTAKTPSDMTSTAVDSSKTKSLTYSAGLFTDNPDVPTISLGGSFQLKSKITQDPADSTIVTALSGKLGGTTVLGFDTAQLTTAAATDPPTWQDIIAQMFTGLNDLLTVMFLGQLSFGAGKFLKKKYDASREKKLAPEERIQKLRQETDAAKQKLNDELDTKVEKLNGSKVKPLTDPQAAMKSAGKSSTTADALGKRIRLKKVVVVQADSLQKLARSEGTMTKQEIADLNAQETTLRQTNAELNQKVDPATVENVVKTQTAKVEGVQTKIKAITQDVNLKISTAQKTAISNAQANAEKTIEDMQRVKDQAAEVEKGDIKPKGEEEMGDLAKGEEAIKEIPHFA